MPTMKAAIVKQFGKPLVIEDVPVPQPGPGEVLVKLKACGVCHTDLLAASGDWPVKPVPPFIPGHEVAGIDFARGLRLSQAASSRTSSGRSRDDPSHVHV